MVFGGALPGFPPQMKVHSMVITKAVGTDLPVDPNVARLLDTTLMTLAIEAGGTIEKDGKSIALELKSSNTSSKELRLTPSK